MESKTGPDNHKDDRAPDGETARPSGPQKPAAKPPEQKKPPDQKPTARPAAEKKTTSAPPEKKEPPAKPGEKKPPAKPDAPKAAAAQTVDRKRIEEILRAPVPRRFRQDEIFTREYLESVPQEKLVEIILNLQRMVPKPKTDRMTAGDITQVSFKTPVAAVDYVRLPAQPAQATPGTRPPAWRVRFQCSDTKFRPLGVEVNGDVLVGRVTRNSTPDMDLTLYGGTTLGVSRKHAIIRPTQSALLLIDLESTNGTYRNGAKLTPGKQQTLKDGDVISFGRLHFRLAIERQPSPAATD